MKRAICLITCWERQYAPHDTASHKNGSNDEKIKAVYSTWYLDWLAKYQGEIDIKIFRGRRKEHLDRPLFTNEVILDCGDGYLDLPQKVQKMCEWCLPRYDFILKLDDDVMVRMDRLVADQRTEDYRGFEIECASGKYASGTAYWLSRKAMEVIVSSKMYNTAEDQSVGKALRDAGIPVTDDPRYHCCFCDECQKNFPVENRITSHTHAPSQMYELYERLHANV